MKIAWSTALATSSASCRSSDTRLLALPTHGTVRQ
jgi:hypothetical protein